MSALEGDLFIHRDEEIVVYDHRGTWHNFRKPGKYPFLACEKLLPQAPIVIGSWVRQTIFNGRSILLKVSELNGLRFEALYAYDKSYTNNYVRDLELKEWVPVESPPNEFEAKSLEAKSLEAKSLEAKSLEAKTVDFLPGDLAIANVTPFTIIEIYDNHYLVEDEHSRFFAKGPLRHKPLEVGDWARHIPNGETSLLRRITHIANGKMNTDKRLHAGGIVNSTVKGYSIKAWIAVKSPKEIKAKSLQSIIRTGWDNVTYQGSMAYLRGEALVHRGSEHWHVKHPSPFVQSIYHTYETATLAMEDVEQWLK